MCGIAGVVQFDGQPVDEHVLRRMCAVLAHRGPEGQGCRRLAGSCISVGLAHTRLKIIDLSDQAAQPMANDDGSISLTFNGEIYNYRELRSSLEARGVAFRTSSDTEVLLRLYEAEGEECLQRLEGMFAFAVWDGRRNRLLLARDRAGKKPLYYAANPARLVFASEIKALLQHPGISPDVDDDALPALFLFGYVPTPGTCYRGLRALPPGHLLTADAEGRVGIQEYWDAPVRAGGAGRSPSEAEAEATVRELLTASVRRRLISDVPLGAFLSGGLDSSIVVGLMSRLMREPVRTFSIGFAGDAHFDETAYARLVSRHFGTTHTEFIVQPSAVELVERLVWHHDGPFGDSSAVPTYLLARLTRQHVTVALNGDGGDELFAGYLRFYATVVTERVPAWARRAASAVLAGLPATGDYRSLARRMQKFAGSAALPFIERFSRWNAVFYEDLPRLLPQCREPGASERTVQRGDSRAAIRVLERLAPHLRRCGSASALSQLLYLNMKTYLLDDLLVKMDRCSMAHALETRSPFLDRELVEYAAGLPDHMKVRWGRTKIMLRRAFADLLPPQILRRGKMGFGVPLQRWFRGELRDYLRDLLLAPDSRLRAHVDQGYVRTLVEDHAAGRADHASRLWMLLTFEVWLRQLPSWGSGETAAPAERFSEVST